jgi:hypothetical protein
MVKKRIHGNLLATWYMRITQSKISTVTIPVRHADCAEQTLTRCHSENLLSRTTLPAHVPTALTKLRWDNAA